MVNLRKPTLQDDGVPLTAKAPRVGSEIVIGTHNFADPTTWFWDSSRVTDQAMEVKAGSGGFVWKSTNSDHVNWIDMVSGRMHNQEHWVSEVDHGYSIEVRVDGVVKTPCPPFKFESSDGDYWIDYDNGEINFFTDQTGNTITATFSYSSDSTFYLKPSDGKVLRIEDAEADFSTDIVLETTFEYIVVGYVDVFAPQYMRGSNELDPVITSSENTPPSSPDVGDRYLVAEGGTGDWTGLDGAIVEWSGSVWTPTVPQEEDWTTVVDISMYLTFRNGTWNVTPYPSLTKIPIQDDKYHRVTQIITEARGALPPVQAIGSSSAHLQISDIKEFRLKSRGMKHNIQAIPFNYATARDLHSSLGMELRVITSDHTPISGEIITITFYCTSFDESS
jgi:hypothetical protein